MNIGLYNPYMDSLGGGERYMASLASWAATRGTCTIFWDNPEIIDLASERFGLDLSRVRVQPNIFADRNLWNRYTVTNQLDVCIVLSDGSIPMSFARRNIIHFQVPFSRVSLPLWKRMLYSDIICNSRFTSLHLDPGLTMRRTVIYPPVFPVSHTIEKKEHMVLSVGRIGGLYNAKKHSVLVDAFSRLVGKSGYGDWRLIIVGGLLPTDMASLESLRKQAHNFAVEIIPNVSHGRLTFLYQKAAIYWHAAGYNERRPENMEHFGISTVEAMSVGCVPVVYNGGGQMEVVDDGDNGYLWNTPDELIEKTVSLLETPRKYRAMQLSAKKKSENFSFERFTDSFNRLL